MFDPTLLRSVDGMHEALTCVRSLAFVVLVGASCVSSQSEAAIVRVSSVKTRRSCLSIAYKARIYTLHYRLCPASIEE